MTDLSKSKGNETKDVSKKSKTRKERVDDAFSWLQLQSTPFVGPLPRSTWGTRVKAWALPVASAVIASLFLWVMTTETAWYYGEAQINPLATPLTQSVGSWRARGILVTQARFGWLLAKHGILILFLIWFVVSGKAASFRDWLSKKIKARSPVAGWYAKLPERLRDRFQIRLAYITIASLIYSLYVFVFELLLYGINAFFVTTHEYVAQWALRNLLDGAARFTYLFIAGLLFYSLISLFDRYWLRLAAVIIPLLLFLALHVTPDFKQLFNQITPLKDKGKEALILKFAEECEIEVDIKQVDASRQSGLINARSTGSLSKRPDKSHVTIIYWDTLLDTFTDVEILFATAHEFGHHALVVNNDAKVMRNIVRVCLVIVGFFIAGRGCKFLIRRYHARIRFDEMNDPASIPLVALIVSLLLFIYIPINNAMTLYQERYADWSAARLVVKDNSSREVAINVFEKLGSASLYDPHPPLIFKLFLEDHPTIDERQRFIKSFDVERAGNQPPRHSFLQALYRLL